MNELSWLLYLADVSNAAGGIFGFGAIVALILLLVSVVAFLMGAESGLWDDTDDQTVAARRIFRRAWKWFASAWAALFLLSVIIPEKETIYAIAASEMGERVLATETASKATQALNAWLDRQIAGKPATEAAE